MAKQSRFEQQYKKNTEESRRMWRYLVMVIMECIRQKNTSNDFLEYMVYRKKEVLKRMDESDATYEVTSRKNNSFIGPLIKPTRLIQAPGLHLRVLDVIMFSRFNDAVAMSRVTRPWKVGANIVWELPCWFSGSKKRTDIATDARNFDGSRAPKTLAPVAIARVKSYSRNKFWGLTNVYRYFRDRYRIHYYRIARDTSGIHFEFGGQLASGDITTSDDHSVAMASYLNMVKRRVSIALNTPLDELNIICSGDDGKMSIYFTLEDNQTEIVAKILQEIAYKLGWDIKIEETACNEAQDKVEFLGFTTRKVEIQMDNNIWELDLVTRKGLRCYAKLLWSTEHTTKDNPSNRSILTSKMLSACYMYITKPDILAFALYVLLTLKTQANREYEMPYNMRTYLTYVPVALNYRKILETHLGFSILSTDVKITIVDCDDIEMNTTNYYLNRISKEFINEQRVQGFDTDITHSRVTIDAEALNATVLDITQRHKFAQSTKVENSVDWWQDNDTNPIVPKILNEDQEKLMRQHEVDWTKTISCEHIKDYTSYVTQIEKNISRTALTCSDCLEQTKQQIARQDFRLVVVREE
eukprot:GHVN01007034.1.p1 GENE.GHVN01007034.1~~GHVN01007034.1.p1  ORF type:complete len:583 (-),score=-12.66 GHVN01007034.1:97-1845(-)